MKRSLLLFATLLTFAGSLAGADENDDKKRIIDKGPPPPDIFDDLDDAKVAAKDGDKHIFIACLKRNDPNSIALRKMIEENSIYLDPDKLVIFRYDVATDQILQSFRSHFRIEGQGTPIILITDAWGKALGQNAGKLDKDGYTTWVQKTGGENLVDLPAEDLFNLKANGPMVTQKELIKMRTWTLVSGKKVTAALVEANGNLGTFRTDSDDYLEMDFNHLTNADKAFLSKNLPATGSNTFP
jgi:hypothetical protein